MAKKTIQLTDDNFADHLSFTYPQKLVEGLEIGEGGIDPDSGVVMRLLAWLAGKSRDSTTRRYEMTRHDAAVLLNLVAGWTPENPLAPEQAKGDTKTARR
jgi:hypothetical protein